MKLKRKLALLLAFAMVITSVNVPEAAKKASAEVAAGTKTTVAPAVNSSVGTGLTTVAVSVHMEAADITTFQHKEGDEAAETVMLQCEAWTDADDSDSAVAVNETQTQKQAGAVLNSDSGNASFTLYLPKNSSYTLILKNRTGDGVYSVINETALSNIAFDTYVPAFEELTSGSAGNTVGIANGNTARPLSGKITGLKSGDKYTLFVSSAANTSDGEKAQTFTASASGYDLSDVDMATLFTSYTTTTDTVTLKLVKGEESDSTGKTVILNETYTFKWAEQQFATVTTPVAGQSFIMAAAEIPASLAESFGDSGKTLSYRVTTAEGTQVCTYTAKPNAGESSFTKENGTYVNYTRISSAAINPGTAYKVVLTQGGTEISNICEVTTAAENKAEIVKAPTDGTPAVFDAALYDRLLQLMVKRDIVGEDAKSFTYLNIEELLNETGGRLDLGLPVNSQKAALSVLTGFENIQGITELSLANNNITNAQLETVLANLVYLSKLDLSGNQLTDVPNLTGLKNLGNPSQSEKVNLQNNVIAAAQFTKEAYSAKFDAAVIGKVKTNKGWSRVAQIALTQRSSAVPVVTADKQYTAYGTKRPLAVTVSGLPVLPDELINRAFELKYYLTVKKGASVLKSDVIGTPDSTGKIKYVFTDLDKTLLPDGDNELTFIVEPKNSNYAAATVNQVVTYNTQAAVLTVDEVRYGSVVVSGGIATSTSISRSGAFDESSEVYVEYSENKKFRTSKKKAVTDYAGEIEPATIDGLEQNTTYFFRLVTKMDSTEEDGETYYYPLTDAVKAVTKKVNVTVKASKVKVTKGYNYNRVQSTVTVKTPKTGNIIVTDVTAGFYGNRGYRVASIGRTSASKWFTTYHINANILSTYKGTYKNVYAYVTLKDLDTDDTFGVYLGDKNNKGLSTYKKVKGTIKVKGNNATYTTFAGTIKKSSLISDLDVYVKVSSSSAFDLPEDKENGPIYYANGKYQTTVSGLNAGSAYHAKLYVEKPDGTEYVLKETTYTTAAMPVTAALSSYSLAPGVANAVATVVVDTAVLEKDWAITNVEADFGVSYKENVKPDDVDHVKLDLDDPQITKADDGKYTITAKFSDNVYPDKSNASATGPSGETIELYRVYVQPKVTVTYKNRRNDKTGTIIIDNIARAAADKLTDIDTKIEMTTLTEIHGNKTDSNGDVYKFVKLNGQFAYGLADGVTKYTGTSVANLGEMIEYQLKVYDKAAPETVAVVSQSSLSALTEGMLEQEWSSGVWSTDGDESISFEAGHTYTFTISQITNVEGVEPVKELKSVDVAFAEETPTQAPDPTVAPEFNLNAITDANLKAAILDAFHVDSESEVTKSMVESRTSLDLDADPYTAEDKKIKSLAGIEMFNHLRTLSLAGHAVTDIGGLNQIDTLTYVDFSYNNLTARPALNRVEGLNVVLFGNRIPGESSQLGAAELVMADVYYALEEESGADADIESIETTHPFYFEVSGLDYANYELTLAIGTETFTDSISYWHSNLYEGYDAGEFIEECIEKGVITVDTPVSVSVKLAKYTALEQAAPAETPLEVTKQVTFASAKKFTDVVVKNNTTITLGDTSYSASIWAPNQTFFTKEADLAAAMPSVDDYDYLKVKENVDDTQYDGDKDNDRSENYLDLIKKNGALVNEFRYGNQVVATGVKAGTTEPVKVYLLDAAGNRVLKCNVNAADCGIDSYTDSVYSVKFNSQSKANDVLGQQTQLASYINFSFGNTKKQFKDLKAGTYTLQYVLPNGTVGTAVTPITVKAQAVTETEPVIDGINSNFYTPVTSKKLSITLIGSEYDSTKVAPVIYTRQNGVMTAVGMMTGSKAVNTGSRLSTKYEFVNEAGWTKGNYYVGLKVADGYSVKNKDTYYGFKNYDYRKISLTDPATAMNRLESGYNKTDGSFYAVYDNAPEGAAVKAKLYKYPYSTSSKYNQYVEGEAQTTVASGGSIVMSFTKDGAPVAYEYNVRYTAVYTIGDDVTVHEITATPLQTTFDITRVVDNINYSGKTYYIQKGAKKVTLNAYMTTSLVSGKKVKAQLTDAYGYNVGSAVKLKVTKVKGTDYSKVSGTFGGKKTKLDYGRYLVDYYVGDQNVSTDIAYQSDYSAFDEIHVVDLGSADYYQTRVEAERNADGSITVTADTLRAKSLNMKKFSVELYDYYDDEAVTDVKVSAKAKGKNQVVLTITGAEDIDSVYGYVKYKNKYPLNYSSTVKNYEKERFYAGAYNPSYELDSVTEVSGKTKSTTVTVKAATAGAILRLYKAGTATEVKAVSVEAVGTYKLKAADLDGVDLGYEYDWVISDYKGVARSTGSDYFYAETPVTKTAEGAVTPVTSIKTDVKGKSVGVSVGAKFALNAYGAPARVTDTPVKYAVSKKDKKVISITKDGVIKGKKVGKAVVTITSKDNKKVKTKVTVTVGPKAAKVTKVKANKNGSVTVKWKKAKSSKKAKVAGYIISASTSEDGTYKQVGKVSAKKSSATVKKGLKANKTYYFKVTAYAKSGKAQLAGSDSNAKSAKVKKAAKKKASKKSSKKSSKKKSSKKSSKKKKK